MSKLNATLTQEEIEEELLNNDLLNSGGVESQEMLQQMSMGEKKNLLRGIQQSKEDFHSEAGSRLGNQSTIDNSLSNFPSLSEVTKSNHRNKLKLPRKPSTPKADSDDSSDKCINLLDDDETVAIKFSLPFCIDDGAQPLAMPERPLRRIKNPYFVMKGENPDAAVKRMLQHHNNWKTAYEAELMKIESRSLREDLEYFDGKEDENSVKSDKFNDKENDPYEFVSDSPVLIPKMNNGARLRDSNQCVENSPQPSNRLLQRKTSRDSDCEEVEPSSKHEEPKLSDWSVATRPRSKRNKKLASKNYERSKQNASSAEVEFDFDNKWDAVSSSWRPSQTSNSSINMNNQTCSRRSLTTVTETKEEKVQCPICQQNFAKSKVENHAANCEGYSSSPMDVEEES